MVYEFSEYAPEGYEVDAFRYLSKTELDKKLSLYFSGAYSLKFVTKIRTASGFLRRISREDRKSVV